MHSIEKDNFYGTTEPASVSYLEFGAIDLENNRKNVWDFRLHQKAYDWLMLARYANDLVTYAQMTEKLQNDTLEEIALLYSREIHHPNDASTNLIKLCAIKAFGKKSVSFFELGQTIFGCIEGIEFIQSLITKLGFNQPSQDLKLIEWYGLDISEYFNDLAIRMHNNFNVFTSADVSAFSSQMDVFFAKGVTLLYRVKTPNDLLELLRMSHCAVFDYSFSLFGEQQSRIGTGKEVCYINFEEFIIACNTIGKSLYFRKNTTKLSEDKSRIYVDCVFGSETYCSSFITADQSIRNFLLDKSSEKPEIQTLMNEQLWMENEWITSEALKAEFDI